MMINNIEEKYQQLTDTQQAIFAGYGLRQVKHFVEITLPKVEADLPEGAIVQGINTEGKVQAIHPETQQYYTWISDEQWQTRLGASLAVDLKTDFLKVWEIFQLQEYALIDLSHVHRDFLETKQSA